jgi:hypothetical protein
MRFVAENVFGRRVSAYEDVEGSEKQPLHYETRWMRQIGNQSEGMGLAVIVFIR